jgi:AcrR family transcriptional regulator
MDIKAPVRRAYRSPERQAASLATRRRIAAAATELFLADGYALTPVRSVARAAGVAEKTVYLHFATKAALLKAVVETAIVGDDAPVPVAEREWFRAVVSEADLAEKLRKLVDGASLLVERTGTIFAMARGAAAVDQEAAALWAEGKQGHLADMTRVADSIQAAGLLPAGATLDWATQLLYILVGPETWQLTRVELGLDPAGYREWLHASLTRAFQPQP